MTRSSRSYLRASVTGWYFEGAVSSSLISSSLFSAEDAIEIDPVVLRIASRVGCSRARKAACLRPVMSSFGARSSKMGATTLTKSQPEAITILESCSRYDGEELPGGEELHPASKEPSRM